MNSNAVIFLRALYGYIGIVNVISAALWFVLVLQLYRRIKTTFMTIFLVSHTMFLIYSVLYLFIGRIQWVWIPVSTMLLLLVGTIIDIVAIIMCLKYLKEKDTEPAVAGDG